MFMSVVEVELHRQLGETKIALSRSIEKNAELERQLKVKTEESFQMEDEFRQIIFKKGKEIYGLDEQVKTMKNTISNILLAQPSSSNEVKLKAELENLKRERDFYYKKSNDWEQEFANKTKAIFGAMTDVVSEQVSEIVKEALGIIPSRLEKLVIQNPSAKIYNPIYNKIVPSHQRRLFNRNEDFHVDTQPNSSSQKRSSHENPRAKRELPYQEQKKRREMHSRKDSSRVKKRKEESGNGKFGRQADKHSSDSRIPRQGSSGRRGFADGNSTPKNHHGYNRQR